MTEPQAKPGEVVSVRSLGAALASKPQTLLVKTNDVEVFEIVIPAGEAIPTYEAQGEVILHCLEGRLMVTAAGEDHEVRGGQLLYLSVREPFSLRSAENTSVLVTIVLPREGSGANLIGQCGSSHM